MSTDHIIQTETQLEAVIGKPFEQIREKIYTTLDEPMKAFVGRSPLMFLSTLDGQGQPDVSPKGDAPGFVHVDDNGDLLIPDRLGNRLIFGFRNILRDNRVGMIFVVPNLRETLRVKGRAIITKDPELLDRLSAKGKPALLCTRVEIEECFFHCGRAMIRSHLWQPDAWAAGGKSLMLQSIARRYDADEVQTDEIETQIEDAYRDKLY
ncbi:MAG: MSMEG_1061 family FMN-dependent PPOX-type flavoprotein [Pseudomonadota bacterium]